MTPEVDFISYFLQGKVRDLDKDSSKQRKV